MAKGYSKRKRAPWSNPLERFSEKPKRGKRSKRGGGRK